MKAKKPAGLLPKNTQQLVILVVAVVMVLIMWFTGNSKRTAPVTARPPGSHVQPLDPAAVQEFKQSIQKDQAATRQPLSQGDRGRLEALGLADRIPPGTVLPPDGAPPPSPNRRRRNVGKAVTARGSDKGRQEETRIPVAICSQRRVYISNWPGSGAGHHEGFAAPPPPIHEALTINREEEEQHVPVSRLQSSTANRPTSPVLRDPPQTIQKHREIRKPNTGFSITPTAHSRDCPAPRPTKRMFCSREQFSRLCSSIV